VGKNFWLFLVAGLAIVAVGIWALFVGTEKNHLDLKGDILKVRVLSLGPQASFVAADFRAKNPSNGQFIVKNVEVILYPASGDPITGVTTSKSDVDTIFEYQKLIGPKFNPVLSLQDKIDAGKSGDFMVAARFELTEQAIESRKSLHLKFTDLDGAIAELAEK